MDDEGLAYGFVGVIKAEGRKAVHQAEVYTANPRGANADLCNFWIDWLSAREYHRS